MRFLSTLSAGYILSATFAHSATVIASADIANASFADFESVALGDAAALSVALAGVGITSITGSTDQDAYNLASDTGKALGGNAAGGVSLYEADNAVSVPLFVTATLSFSGTLTQIGMDIGDQNGQFAFSFLRNNVVVDTGSATLSGVVSAREVAFSATEFDKLTISFDATNSGFTLDNLTVGAVTTVPVPAGLPLLMAGLAGFGILARRKTRAARV